MNDAKLVKVEETRKFLEAIHIKFKELKNGHFQIYHGTKVVMQYWCTTEKLHVAAGDEWLVGWDTFKSLCMERVDPFTQTELVRSTEKPTRFPLKLARKAATRTIDTTEEHCTTRILTQLCALLLEEAGNDNIQSSGLQITMVPKQTTFGVEYRATIDYMNGGEESHE